VVHGQDVSDPTPERSDRPTRRARPAGGRSAGAKSLSDGVLDSREAEFRIFAELTSDYWYALRGQRGEGLVAQRVDGRFAEITGYTPVPGDAFAFEALIHPDDRPAARERVARLVEGGTSEHEFRIVTRTGETRWVRERVRMIRDGDLFYVFGAARDITEQRAVEQAADESEERFRRLSEQSADLISEVGVDGRLTYVSPNHLAQLGYDPAELVGRSALEVARLLGSDRASELEGLPTRLDALREASPFNRLSRVRRRDGSWRWYETEGTSYRTPGGSSRALVLSRDVTARVERQLELERTGQELEERVELRTAALREANQRLRRSEAQAQSQLAELEKLYDSSPIGLCFIDRQRRYVRVNDQMARINGRPASEHIGRRVDEVLAGSGAPPLPNTPLVLALLDEVLQGKRLDRLEFRSASPAEPDHFRDWLFSSFPVHAPDGAILGACGLLQDITEFKEIQAALERRTSELESLNVALRRYQDRRIEAHRLAAAEELVGGVAHAIANPLTALIGEAEMGLETAPGASPRLERILRLGLRISETVDRLLSLHLQGTLELSLVAIPELLAEVASDLGSRCEKQGVRVHVRTPAALDLVADRTLLATALTALADNALDAMPDGGELWVEAQELPGMNVVTIRLADTGPGIPEELRGRVREAFFTTKQAGNGLGLAIAEGVARGHRGRISIGDRRGGGAELMLELPQTPARPFARQPDPA
jgi:PAS domain S-box-containing protein